jgi:glycosyltransferase involved in cell wall biosynthesis
MTASVCIATRGKKDILDRVLRSIYYQLEGREKEIEVIIVDDGMVDNTFKMVSNYPGIVYQGLPNDHGYRNPAVARNMAAKLARGKILVLQSDDVIHYPGSLDLMLDLPPGRFNISKVINQYSDGNMGDVYTGESNPRPLFFLGSVLRRDFYAIGGNDEEFVEPGYEDNWLGCCLHRGAGIHPLYRDDSLGFHQDHPRPDNNESYRRMYDVFQSKLRRAEAGEIPWCASGGPWRYVEGKSWYEIATNEHDEPPGVCGDAGAVLDRPEGEG